MIRSNCEKTNVIRMKDNLYSAVSLVLKAMSLTFKCFQIRHLFLEVWSLGEGGALSLAVISCKKTLTLMVKLLLGIKYVLVMFTYFFPYLYK